MHYIIYPYILPYRPCFACLNLIHSNLSQVGAWERGLHSEDCLIRKERLTGAFLAMMGADDFVFELIETDPCLRVRISRK